MTTALGACANGVRGAFGFLTRIPVGMGRDPGLRWASAHFPLVGACIGGLGALVWAVSWRLDTTTRAWLVIAALLLITGAFHEDGLADTADALGGAYTRERLFAILKDSRIGTFGTVALIVGLALRAALLCRLLPQSVWYLIASQGVSRLGPVLLMSLFPYVTASDTSRSQAVIHANRPQCLLAVGWTLCLLLGLAHWAPVSVSHLLFGLCPLGLTTGWLAWRFWRRTRGITGDFLGATQQVGELAFLLGFALCPG
jgi:adenosylcobinamide-GDP ribazoletransferase